MAHWINYRGKAESTEYACHIIGVGYIPWSPEGGRHIMDDFGELHQALPYLYYLDERDNWKWEFYQDQTYSYH